MIFKNRRLIPMCCLKTPLKLRFNFLDEPYEIKIKYAWIDAFIALLHTSAY